MYKSGKKNEWTLFLLILAGIVLGSFIASILGQAPSLSWMNFGQSFGITNPLKLDLGVITLQFAFTIKITVGSIIGIVAAIFIYKKI